jgi:hypothetical protein
MPTLLVQLEDAAGVFNQDITQYANLAPSWTARRGRNDEETGIEPGRLEMLLDNSDGKFTLGSASFGGITVDKRIRVSETVGGVTTKRHTGYVQDWPTEWESPLGNTAVCRITSMDRLSRLNRRKLRSTTEQEILVDLPFAYYAMGEAAGATSAGDTSGNSGPALAATYALPGTPAIPPTFGAAGMNTWDGITAAQFAALNQMLRREPIVWAGSAATFEIVFSSTNLPAATEFLLALGPSFLNIIISTAGRAVFASILTSGAAITDGQPHHLAATLSGGTLTAYVDGVSIGTTAAPEVPAYIALGDTSTAVIATVAHLALYTTALSAARIAAHANAVRNGLVTDRFDQRIARLASYANIAPADQSLETGQTPSIAAASTTDQNVLPAMNDVADAEGGRAVHRR